MAKSIPSKLLVVAALTCVTSMSAWASGKAGLRLICDGEFRNSDVYINNKPSGNCPADIEVPAGAIDLRVTKTDTNGVLREYKESFSVGPNSIRRVEIVRSATRAVVNRTKDETVSWITEKLRQEVEGAFNMSGSYNFDAKVSVNNDQLEIGFTTSPCSDCGPRGKSHHYAYRFPINEISKVQVVPHQYCPGSRMFFSFPKTCESCMSSFNGGSFRPMNGGFGMCIRNSEDNLSARFSDAFQHLQTFYPPPKQKNEAF